MKWINKLIIILALLLQCVGIADHSLWTPDEPREAQIIHEMSVRGDYLIPYFAGEAFLEKPPLYYALGVISYNMLGNHFQEVGRVASLIFALATLAVVYLTIHRIRSEHEAAFACLVLASFPLFFVASHKILVDIGLMFFVTAALCAFLIAYHEKVRSWYWGFWVSMAGAFLCKGAIGLAIPGMTLLVFTIWQRDVRFIRQAYIIPGVLLVLGVIALWAGVLYARGGASYLYTFFMYNQVGRFIPVGIIYKGGHVRPFYYYLLAIPALTAPFSLLLIPALAKIRNQQSPDRFFLSWLAGGLLILSFSSTKREIYFLPMLPAMAMYITGWASRLGGQKIRPWESYFLKAIPLIILTVAALLPVAYVKIGGTAQTAVLVSVAAFTALLIVWKLCRSELLLFAILGWSLVFVLWAPVAIPQVDKGKSYKETFEEMGALVDHKQVVGYNLTETVEGLSRFYGKFYVKNIEDRGLFMHAIENHEAEYIMILPGRDDDGMRKELAAKARMVFRNGGEMRREVELWKMSPSLLPEGTRSSNVIPIPTRKPDQSNRHRKGQGQP